MYLNYLHVKWDCNSINKCCEYECQWRVQHVFPLDTHERDRLRNDDVRKARRWKREIQSGTAFIRMLTHYLFVLYWSVFPKYKDFYSTYCAVSQRCMRKWIVLSLRLNFFDCSYIRLYRKLQRFTKGVVCMLIICLYWSVC